jgi:integrase
MSNGKKEFPKTITHPQMKGLSGKIYRMKHGDGSYQYSFVYYTLTGETQRKYSRDLESLIATAEGILNDLAGGKPVDASEVPTAHERAEGAALRAIFAEVGIAPLIGARHFVEGVKILGKDLVLEACRTYAARNMHKAADMTVEQVKNEMITSKRAAGRSLDHTDGLKWMLGAFAESCRNTKIGDVTQPIIKAFLNGLKDAAGNQLSPRSYNNYRLSILSMFRFAIAQKWLPRDWDEMAGIEVAEDGVEEITLYSAPEIEAFLNIAKANEKYAALIPFFALGAFAGLRSAEILRLDWSAVRLDTGYVTLAGKKKDSKGKVTRLTKTGMRRVVPINAALRAWVKDCAKLNGPVWDMRGKRKERTRTERPLYHLIAKLCAEPAAVEAGLKWKKNALRHSYCTYRLAQCADINRVALESGNSPKMINANYNALATEDQAAVWFAIRPAKK